MNKSILKNGYFQFLGNLKERLGTGRYKAAIGINHELILLYHHIGLELLKAQEMHGWGAKIIDNLSHDLRSEFPEMKGFSLRNLKYMRKFAVEYPDAEFVQQVVAQLPWGHNIFLMEQIPIKQERIFYINKAIQHGWSRSNMAMHIEIALHTRHGPTFSKFSNDLPFPEERVTKSILSDEHITEFLNIGQEIHNKN